MVGGVSTSIKQAYLRQPETVGNGGCQEGFREGGEIPVQDSIAGWFAKNPANAFYLRG